MQCSSQCSVEILQRYMEILQRYMEILQRYMEILQSYMEILQKQESICLRFSTFIIWLLVIHFLLCL